MIHRALFGSVERFFAVLLEHYAGDFPTWLVAGAGPGAPGAATPTRTTPGAVARELHAAGLRVEVDEASEPLGTRIRRGKLEKIPYLLVVGDDDVAHGTVGVNARGSDAAVRGVPAAEFARRVTAEVLVRSSPEAAGGPAGAGEVPA